MSNARVNGILKEKDMLKSFIITVVIYEIY